MTSTKRFQERGQGQPLTFIDKATRPVPTPGILDSAKPSHPGVVYQKWPDLSHPPWAPKPPNHRSRKHLIQSQSPDRDPKTTSHISCLHRSWEPAQPAKPLQPDPICSQRALGWPLEACAGKAPECVKACRHSVGVRHEHPKKVHSPPHLDPPGLTATTLVAPPYLTEPGRWFPGRQV